jgi:hypothetical protein
MNPRSSQDVDQQSQDLYCLTERLDDSQQTLIRHCKFYLALTANEILKETPINEICDEFKCNRGHI